MNQIQRKTINDLPLELLFNIFKHLDGEDIKTQSKVSKLFLDISRLNPFWKPIYIKIVPTETRKEIDSQFKLEDIQNDQYHYYRICHNFYMISKNWLAGKIAYPDIAMSSPYLGSQEMERSTFTLFHNNHLLSLFGGDQYQLQIWNDYTRGKQNQITLPGKITNFSNHENTYAITSKDHVNGVTSYSVTIGNLDDLIEEDELDLTRNQIDNRFVRIQSNDRITNVHINASSLFIGYLNGEIDYHDNKNGFSHELTLGVINAPISHIVADETMLFVTYSTRVQDDFVIDAWEYKLDAHRFRIPEHSEQITCLKIHHNNLISASMDGSMFCWNRNNGTEIQTLILSDENNAITHVKIIDDRVFAGLKNSLVIFEKNENEQVYRKIMTIAAPINDFQIERMRWEYITLSYANTLIVPSEISGTANAPHQQVLHTFDKNGIQTSALILPSGEKFRAIKHHVTHDVLVTATPNSLLQRQISTSSPNIGQVVNNVLYFVTHSKVRDIVTLVTTQFSKLFNGNGDGDNSPDSKRRRLR